MSNIHVTVADVFYFVEVFDALHRLSFVSKEQGLLKVIAKDICELGDHMENESWVALVQMLLSADIS